MVPIYMLCDGSLGDCDCISRRAAAQREANKALNTPVKKHGRSRMYKKCKCAICRKWNAKRMRDYRAKKKKEENN